MIAKCRQCGKHTVILYPDLWAYKQGHDTYYCSWKCLRAREKEEEALTEVVSKEQKDRAVQIAIEGGDPRHFLKECGSKNPYLMWGRIREHLMKNNPDLYERLPDKIPRKERSDKGSTHKPTMADAMTGMKDAADEFFGKCEEAGLKITETPEGEYTDHKIELPRIPQPAYVDDMLIREVEGLFGRYRYSDIGSTVYIDFEPTDSVDTLSYTLNQWREFRKEQERAAKILGVEL